MSCAGVQIPVRHEDRGWAMGRGEVCVRVCTHTPQTTLPLPFSRDLHPLSCLCHVTTMWSLFASLLVLSNDGNRLLYNICMLVLRNNVMWSSCDLHMLLPLQRKAPGHRRERPEMQQRSDTFRTSIGTKCLVFTFILYIKVIMNYLGANVVPSQYYIIGFVLCWMWCVQMTFHMMKIFGHNNCKHNFSVCN